MYRLCIHKRQPWVKTRSRTKEASNEAFRQKDGPVCPGSRPRARNEGNCIERIPWNLPKAWLHLPAGSETPGPGIEITPPDPFGGPLSYWYHESLLRRRTCDRS